MRQRAARGKGSVGRQILVALRLASPPAPPLPPPTPRVEEPDADALKRKEAAALTGEDVVILARKLELMEREAARAERRAREVEARNKTLEQEMLHARGSGSPEGADAPLGRTPLAGTYAPDGTYQPAAEPKLGAPETELYASPARRPKCADAGLSPPACGPVLAGLSPARLCASAAQAADVASSIHCASALLSRANADKFVEQKHAAALERQLEEMRRQQARSLEALQHYEAVEQQLHEAVATVGEQKELFDALRAGVRNCSSTFLEGEPPAREPGARPPMEDAARRRRARRARTHERAAAEPGGAGGDGGRRKLAARSASSADSADSARSAGPGLLDAVSPHPRTRGWLARGVWRMGRDPALSHRQPPRADGDSAEPSARDASPTDVAAEQLRQRPQGSRAAASHAKEGPGRRREGRRLRIAPSQTSTAVAEAAPVERSRRRKKRRAGSVPEPPAVSELDMETVFEGSLKVALYDYDDILVRSAPPYGHAFVESEVNSGAPLYLQVNGKPQLSILVKPAHRLFMYGGSSAYGHFHLGEGLASTLGERPALSTQAFYAEGGDEEVRRVRVLRLKSDAPSPIELDAAPHAEHPPSSAPQPLQPQPQLAPLPQPQPQPQPQPPPASSYWLPTPASRTAGCPPPLGGCATFAADGPAGQPQTAASAPQALGAPAPDRTETTVLTTTTVVRTSTFGAGAQQQRVQQLGVGAQPPGGPTQPSETPQGTSCRSGVTDGVTVRI